MATGGHILEVRKSLSISFLATSDRYGTFFSGGHFGCPKITFDRISGHFRLIGHFGCSKIIFNRIFGYFRSTQNFSFDKMAGDGHF